MANWLLAEELESQLVELGATFIAVAALDLLPQDLRGGFPRGVLIGRALDPEIVAGITHGPTPGYLAEYTRVNSLLDKLAADCASFLEERGHRALAGKASAHIPDRTKLATELPHKTVATLSGAGWIGRCALLVTRQWGSAVRINTVLTDAPLPAGEPVEESHCGDCDCCVIACPAGAPRGQEWSQGMEREEIYDALACRDCASRLSLAIGSERSICGICIAACPHTTAYLIRARLNRNQ